VEIVILQHYMSRERESLILRLQERNTEIDNEIKKLQQDWILNQQKVNRKREERREGLEKARAWHLDRIKAKRK